MSGKKTGSPTYLWSGPARQSAHSRKKKKNAIVNQIESKHIKAITKETEQEEEMYKQGIDRKKEEETGFR